MNGKAPSGVRFAFAVFLAVAGVVWVAAVACMMGM